MRSEFFADLMKTLVLSIPQKPPRIQVKKHDQTQISTRKTFTIQQTENIFSHKHYIYICMMLGWYWQHDNEADRHVPLPSHNIIWGGVRGRGTAKRKIIIIMNHDNVLPVTEAQMRGPQTQTWRNKVSENVSQNKWCLSCSLNVHTDQK